MNTIDLSLKDYLFEILNSHYEKKAFSIYRKGWQSFSYAEVLTLSLNVARQIKKYNLSPSDKIAIILDSCPEYSSAFFGAGLLGHTALLLDAKLGVKEMESIVLHSDSKLIITGFGASGASVKLTNNSEAKLPILYIDEIAKETLGKTEIESGLNDYQGHKAQDTALLVYTSGTTSAPKGVMVSLQNLIFDSMATIEAVGPNKNATFLSILPMHHLLEFTGGMMQGLLSGAHLVYANTMLPHEIIERFQAFDYTDMIVVPLFLKTLKKSLLREINKSFLTITYFKTCMFLSKHIKVQAFRRLIFTPVLKKLGNLLRFISGGAPLDLETELFFSRLGITVVQGYGLTETSPISTVTYKGNKRVGTQGRTLPGTEIKVDPLTTEILIRGPHVMQGYYKEPEATARAFTSDGWFRSGDLGHIYEDGNLLINGRLKELIVLGSGKKIFPDEVEHFISESENIKELIIVGAEEKNGHLKGTETVCAVVVPSDEFWNRDSDKTKLKALLSSELAKRVAGLSAYKRPSRIFFSLTELPKTSTRKHKRTMIRKMIEEGVFQ